VQTRLFVLEIGPDDHKNGNMRLIK